MMKRSLKFRALIILCLLITLCSSEAFAWGGGHDGRHFYRGGRWYRHGVFGIDFAITALTIGALVDSLPPRYNSVYYRPCPEGYVVVPAPVITQPIVVAPPPPQPVFVNTPAPIGQPQSPDMVTINIPNSRGGYTAITLRKSGNGYIGPQGEYYSENPTVDQLKTLYGK